MGNNTFLVNDLVVYEDVCNSRCTYCITSTSDLKEKHKLMVNKNTYDNESLMARLDQITEALFNKTGARILKVSGGEIFLVKNILKFIEKHGCSYKRIQILTNGLLLNEELVENLSKIQNVCVQISIDGHTMEMNRYRVEKQKLQDKILSGLRLCQVYNIPVEINCVLTDANTDKIYTFAEYLTQYDHVILQPFPIRGTLRDKFYPKEEQIKAIEILIENYSKYEHVLLSRVYYEKLYEFMTRGKGTERCYIPFMIYQAFDDGVLTPCPNIWFKSLGNILYNEEETLDKLNTDSFYTVLKRSKHLLLQCQNCFTPWEILNLYLHEKVTIEDIRKIYLFNDPEIIKYLENMKDSIKINS